MILLSLNIRGVGGSLKLASMRRLLSKNLPNIIFLQETLVAVEKARNFMYLLRPEWMICGVSYVGKSGGILVSWDPNVFDLVLVLSCGGIFLTGTSLANKRKVSFLNVYGPCQDRKNFWDKVDRRGLLAHDDLIMAGDMNFTTNSEEVWGVSALADPLVVFFKEIFLKNNLVDVAPAVVVPTWRNGRVGDEGIAKRLDRIYMVEDLITSSLRYRAWVEYPFISDHAPVLLQLGDGLSSVAHPFKLNHA
jgi:endonuclease/exonuclease/phosphatase family metal-dependent hydrolase